MSRPKSSIVGFVDLALNAKNTISIGKLRNEVNQDSLSFGFEIDSLRNAQIKTIESMVEIHNKLEFLEAISQGTLNELKRQDKQEDVLGDLKVFLIEVEDQLSKIETMSQNYPEYAALLAEDLATLLDSHGVHHTQFKRMNQDGIKWAKSVIQQVKDTENRMKGKLGWDLDI